MKKLLIAAVGVFIVFATTIVLLLSFDFNRAGKENAYVQIVTDGELEEIRLDSGEIMKRYWYNQPAYDAEGNEINVEFSSHKNLRKEAYLMLYLKKENEVSSYDEVQFEDIPKAAQEKL